MDKAGGFKVTFKESAKVAPSTIKASLGKKYSIKEMSIEIAGELAVSDKPEEKGLWFATKSGQKMLLANRAAKDDKDKPEDLVAKMDEALKAGNKVARVSGVVTEDKDGNLTLALVKAEAAAAMVEEKK